MPPKLRARSSSRSRTAPSSVKKMVSPASKSPARGRGRPSKKDATPKTDARQASKSATPRKSVAKSRSRSRSRGRPTLAETASSSVKRTVRTPRESKKDVVVTSEVADDDELPATSTPRRSQRDLRTQTQSPPRARVTPHTSPKTFASPAKSTATSSSSCTTLSCIKSKMSAAYAWTDSHVRLLLTLIAFIIYWPYDKVSTVLESMKPKGVVANALLYTFFTFLLCVGLFFAFPLAVYYGRDIHEHYAEPFFQYVTAHGKRIPVFFRKHYEWVSTYVKQYLPAKST